jgi:hypothetical protein
LLPVGIDVITQQPKLVDPLYWADVLRVDLNSTFDVVGYAVSKEDGSVLQRITTPASGHYLLFFVVASVGIRRECEWHDRPNGHL